MNVFFHTFGCKANQADTERVRQAFEDRGATVVDRIDVADLAVVNSCTVTHVGEAKMRRYVARLARQRPGVETIVMGCAAAVDDGRLSTLPSVRRVVPGAEPEAVLEAAGVRGGALDPVLRRFRGSARAWLKVQDGCDEHCTFCATTLARGANRSRAPQALAEEARAMSQHHAEIVLTGVHIGAYGKDRADGATLSRLVDVLLDAVPEVRFRLSSVEATEVDDRLLSRLAEGTGLAPHLHAPLQSGSDRLLKRMGRYWYTAESYARRIEQLVGGREATAVGADVIVGFPGETVADHAATCALVERLPFTYLHIFPYSPRPGAASTRLGAPVEPRIQKQRAAELRALAEGRGSVYRARRAGQLADGVFSGRRHGRMEFLTEDYLSVYLSSDRWDGRVRRPVTVTSA